MLPESAPPAEAVAEVFAPKPAFPAKSPGKRRTPSLEIAATCRAGGHI
jgi:hypothetical protein